MGKLIVIDGLDGCGKATQAALIGECLTNKGYKVKNITFPEYSSDSSAAVKMYLNGALGDDPSKLNPYMCSLFYTVDRAIQFITKINKWYEEGYILLADRYLSANVIYQGEKFSNLEDQESFFKWVYEIETKLVGLPVEDITLALTLPIETSQKLLYSRYNGTDKRDIHESDVDFLNGCSKSLDNACKYLPTIGYNWVRVDCSDGSGGVRSRDEIRDQLLDLIMPILEN